MAVEMGDLRPEAGAETFLMRWLIKGEVWLHPGPGGWHFVTIKRDIAARLRQARERSSAWGSIRVNATLGDCRWTTSVFPDAKAGTYLLPIKADVRRKTGIGAGVPVCIALEIAA